MVRTLASVQNPRGIVARKLNKIEPINKNCVTKVKRKVAYRNVGNRCKKQPIPKWQKEITLFFDREDIVNDVDLSANIKIEVDVSKDDSDIFDNDDIIHNVNGVENYYEVENSEWRIEIF